MTRSARVGTGCLPVFILLSTIQAVSPQPAFAQGPQASGAVIACVDPRAVYALTDRNRPEHHNAKWRASMERHGRCSSIPPGEHWEPIYRSGGLMVMRRTPPEPGVPPLFFRMGALPAGANDAIALPQGRRFLSPPRPVPLTPQRPDDRSINVVTQALPSPAAIAPPAPARQAPTSTPAPAPPPAVPAGAVMPGKAAAALPTPRPAVPATALLPRAPPAKAASTAAARGYAVGFAMAILLVVLLLAALALLLLLLFRRSRNGTQPQRDDAADDPLLSPQAPRAAPQPVSPPGPPALVRGVTPAPAAPAALQPAGLPASQWPPDDGTDTRGQCAVLLREAGWHTGVGMTAYHADLVARRDGRVMVLRCLTDTPMLDEHAVEEVCMTRERERADIAVIVSNASCTKSARQLAARTGVDLLREDELRDYAA